MVMTAVVYWFMPPAANVWHGALVFGILAVASELKPVSIRGSMADVTISVPVYIGALVLFGPLPAMAVAAIAVFGANLIARGCAQLLQIPAMSRSGGWLLGTIRDLAGPWEGRANYPLLWTFNLIGGNAALDVINVGLAAVAYKIAGGTNATLQFFTDSSAPVFIMGLVVPFFIAVTVHFLVDEARFVIMGILAENRPEDLRDWYSFFLRWRIIFIQSVGMLSSQYLILPPITFLMIYLYVHLGVASGLVVLGPFLSLRLVVQKAVEQERVYLDTIATLATYMQHYHPYTRGHLKRVADMSSRLARELRLPAETVMLMPYAGLLHDIGKVGVSEEILDKVGKLTDEEWARIKEHPVKGAEIVEHLDFLNRTVNWIRYHHKWADGSGYPDDGVKNGGVPVEAAIIAVADAFDAMTDDREMSLDWICDSCVYKPEDGERPDTCPQCGAQKRRTYREPLSVDGAIGELRRGVGTQFSPAVVKAFLKMVDREGIKVGGSD